MSKDDSRGSVPSAQLRKDRPDMGLHGGHTHKELLGNLAVARSLGHQAKHVVLPNREDVDQVSGLSLSWSLPAIHLEHAGCHGWVEPRSPTSYHLHRPDQFFRRGFFERKTRSACLKCADKGIIVVKGGEDQNRRASFHRRYRGGCLDPVHTSHPDVHTHNINVVGRKLTQCLGTITRFGDNLEAIVDGKDVRKTGANERLIVNQEKANHETTSVFS